MSRESTDPRTLLAEARVIDEALTPEPWLVSEHGSIYVGDIRSAISSMGDRTDASGIAWMRTNLRTLIDGYAAALDEVDRLRELATLAGNAAITAADELRQPRVCVVCGACKTHDVPAEIAKLTSERDLGNRLLSHAVEYQHRLEADVDRLRAEVEFRRANPLHCAVSRAGETTFECDAAKPCAPCMARMEIERLLTQCDEDMYCMSQEAIELACSRNK